VRRSWARGRRGRGEESASLSKRVAPARGRGCGRGSGCATGRIRAVRPGQARGRHGSDQGSASVWSLGAIAVLCVVFGAVLALGQAVVVRHRAAGGADLAALAAADHWAEGGAAACARAGRVAAAQGVRLVRCVIEGETSDVTAASGRGPFAAEVRARAGPAGAVPPEVSRQSPAPEPAPPGSPAPPSPAAPPAAAP
jgi:secretion/DNA translocation related TadE-like protein